MSWKLALAGLALISASATFAQDKRVMTARDYYDELKAANNFNQYNDTYVCFRDDDVPSFAVISRGSDIIDEMNESGHTPEKAVVQAKDALFVEIYFKGVANKLQPYAPVVGKEGTDWYFEFSSPAHGKIVYSINWKTGRYRMLTYALDYNKTLPADESSGKCELIHTPDDPSMKLQPLFENRCFNSKTKEEQKKVVEEIEALPEAEFKKTMKDFDAINASDRLLGTKGCELGKNGK
jgi:hypothetical protein